jgi:hypothetical protein
MLLLPAYRVEVGAEKAASREQQTENSKQRTVENFGRDLEGVWTFSM